MNIAEMMIDGESSIQWLSSNQIKVIKREACREIFRKSLKENLLQSFTPKEKFLEFTVWSTTFDEIEEFFAVDVD